MLVRLFGIVAIVVHFLGGIDNGTVTGAAAQITRNCIVDLLARWFLRRFVQREQGHDEARRAEPALRAMAVHQRPLDRV